MLDVEETITNDSTVMMMNCCDDVVPPRSLNMSLSPSVVRAGQLVTLTCVSSTSNPASRLSWWNDGRQVSAEIRLIRLNEIPIN